MKIACIGWGSLIWNPESLLIHRQWFNDGPLLPVEFARQSRDGRLTLVLLEKAKPIRTLWALMAINDLPEAKKSLQIREGISDENIDKFIASVSNNEVTKDTNKIVIQQWLNVSNLDAAIWTNLPPRFNNKNNTIPTLIQASNYLSNLNINERTNAEIYIRRTPLQVDTEYRRHFEKTFGWTPSY